MPVSTRRDELLQKRLDRFTQLLHGLKRSNVRSIHRTRVASRRLREVLPVLQLDADVAHKVGRRLRKVTKRLGAVRELDVLLLEIEKLSDSGRYPGRALGRVAAAVAEERNHARTRLEAKLPVSALHRLAAKIAKIARGLQEKDADARSARPALRAWRWAIDARIARRSATLGSAITAAGALYLPERLHGVRISVKKLRYALEMLADLTGAKTTPELRQLRRTQDYLGRLHDLQVLMDRVRQVQASLTPPDLAAWRELDVLVASLEDQCRRLHGRYMREHDALMALAARLSGRGAQLAARRSAARRAS